MKFNNLIIVAQIIILLSGYVFLSCSKTIDYPYESSSNKVVVNCILNPDSIVSISLTIPNTYPTENDSFTVIKNAVIKFFENEMFIDYLIFNNETDSYELDFNPKVAENYSVSISMSGQPEISAHTYIPNDFIFYSCLQPLKQNQYINEVATRLSSLQKDESYWVYFLSDDYSYYRNIQKGRDPGYKTGPFVHGISSYNRIFDDFNSLFSKYGYLEYDYIIRLPYLDHEFYDFGIFSSNFALWPNRPESINWQKDKFQMIVVKASKEADVYWKSVFLNYINKNWEIPNPFYEPVIVPSNIVNGTGVFAGVNSKSSFPANYPCD